LHGAAADNRRPRRILRRDTEPRAPMPDAAARLTLALADRYRFERELGAGGMATVYLAHDVRHDRKVALKVLRPELAAVIGADRFLKEIKVTANLQHPHILGLIDSGEADGLLYYVMPFVEGESLRDRLTREKQLPVDDAVRITREVASALDYAHRHHVIHRDIKPENILLHDGQALVADFGIALALSSAGGTRMTETGMSLGTPHYMSPEQAMGEREVTARSDVYALGCVLYEMLVGDPPFTGSTAQAIVAKVLTETPRPLLPQRHTVPPHVEAAVITALEKLPADRFGTAAEFSDALAHPSPVGERTQRPAPAATRTLAAGDAARWRMVAGVLAVVAIALGGLAGLGWWRPGEHAAVSRFVVELEGGLDPTFPAAPAISPDGAHLTYNIVDGQLMLRDRDRLEATPVPDGETGQAPFFSPDGKRLAFFTGLPGALRVVSLSGGAATTLVADSAYGSGGSWGEDGWIYYVGGASQALMRVRAEGGKPQVVASPNPAHNELFFNWPQILPGGRTALITIWRRKGAADIAALDIASAGVTVLTRGLRALYAPTGHLIVLQDDGSLVAVRFDPRRLTLGGRPTTVLQGVWAGGAQELPIALSGSGTLIYQTAPAAQQVVRVTRDGNAQPVDPGWSGLFQQLDLSPDGTRLAVTVVQEGRAELWVKALATGPLTRLVWDGTLNYRPSWAPDGRSILYVSDVSGHSALYRVPADGSAPPTLLRDDPRAVDEGSLSRDGRWLIFRAGSGGGRDIYAIRPGVDSLPIPLATSSAEEYSPSLSPDSRWLAYASDQSNRSEVYVRPFPNAGAAKWQVSREGGSEPLWAHNGRELFYRNAAGDLVAAEVAPGPFFRITSERILFAAIGYNLDNRNHHYTVSGDDRSFLFVRGKGSTSSHLVVVQNWFEELKAKVGK
jgi:Tol biopolymer transport system component